MNGRLMSSSVPEAADTGCPLHVPFREAERTYKIGSGSPALFILVYRAASPHLSRQLALVEQAGDDCDRSIDFGVLGIEEHIHRAATQVVTING
jgi:hypothetical protein